MKKYKINVKFYDGTKKESIVKAENDAEAGRIAKHIFPNGEIYAWFQYETKEEIKARLEKDEQRLKELKEIF